jgi:eukaryotic-like serine/threonine-protein kinase
MFAQRFVPTIGGLFAQGRGAGRSAIRRGLEGISRLAGERSPEIAGSVGDLGRRAQDPREGMRTRVVLEPSNTFLRRDGRVVLVDFGLVKDPDRTRLTRTGLVMGTISYLVPELWRG